MSCDAHLPSLELSVALSDQPPVLAGAVPDLAATDAAAVSADDPAGKAAGDWVVTPFLPSLHLFLFMIG